MKLRKMGVWVGLATVAVVAGLLVGAGPAAAGERGDGSLSLGQIQSLAERATGERLGDLQRVVVVDGVTRDLTPEQMDALLAGKDVDGITVRLAVDDPSLDSTVGDLFDKAGVTGSTSARVILDFKYGPVRVSAELIISDNCTTTSVTTTITTTDDKGNTTIETETTTSTVCIV